MSFQTEIDAVYEIIHGSLVHCRAGAFPRFRDLLADTFQRRQPVPGSHPWLLLPILTGEVLGGRAEPLYRVAAAFEIGRIAAGCLDEWQDQDTEGALWRTLGGPRTVNLATAMLSLSSLMLDGLADLGVPAVAALALRQEFDLCLLRMCEGQHADLSDELALADYETVAGAKSGSLFRLGCRAGALAAGAPGEVVELYGEFGHHLGVLAQIWNDVQGLWDEGGKMDAKRRRALPRLAAHTLDADGYTPGSAEGLAADLYTLVLLQTHHQRAAQALARCPAPGRLSIFLDDYSVQPLVELATRQKGSREG